MLTVEREGTKSRDRLELRKKLLLCGSSTDNTEVKMRSGETVYEVVLCFCQR